MLTLVHASFQSGMPNSKASLEDYESDDGMPKVNPARSELDKDYFRFYKRKLKRTQEEDEDETAVDDANAIQGSDEEEPSNKEAEDDSEDDSENDASDDASDDAGKSLL